MRLPHAQVIESPRATEQEQYLEDLALHSGQHRVWVAFGKLADQEAWERMLGPARLAGYRAPGGAEVFLCDLSRLSCQP